MKKKVLALAVVGVLAISSVVSAASIWGTYKGNDIIRITVDGSPIKVKDVPAISYNDRTMIPINFLNQARIPYTWDQKNKTVDIITKPQSTSFNPSEEAGEILDLGGGGVTLTEIGNKMTAITYFKSKYGFEKDWDSIFKVFVYLSHYKAEYARVEYEENELTGIVEVKTDDLEKFIFGLINDQELQKKWMISGPLFSNTTTTGNNNSSNSIGVKTSFPDLYSNDLRVYLGKLTTNSYDSDSIFNEYGTYGSKYQSKSIWNQYGTYGSDYSSESAFNKYATKPPAIVLNGKVIGYVTLNTNISNGISPLALKNYLYNLGY